MREQRREQEQPADTVRRAVAKEEPGVQEQEQPADTVRQAVAREELGVRFLLSSTLLYTHLIVLFTLVLIYTCINSTLRLQSIVLFTFWCLFFTEQYFTLHAFNSSFHFFAYFTECTIIFYTCIQLLNSLLHIFFINFYYPHNQHHESAP